MFNIFENIFIELIKALHQSSKVMNDMLMSKGRVGKSRVFRIFENRFTVITKAFQVLVCLVCNNILVWKQHDSVPI